MKPYYCFIPLLILFTGGCMSKKAPPYLKSNNISIIRTEKDCKSSYDQIGIIEGTYKTLYLPVSAEPDSPLMPSKRITIRLDDGYELALETHEAGYRKEEEKKMFLDKRVFVKGKLVRFAQLWGSREESSIVMDAIQNIENIEIVPKP